MVYSGTFKKQENIDPYTLILHYDYYKEKYDRREVRFKSGKNELLGYIYGLDNKKLVIFAHGIWSGPEEYLGLITYLVDNGFMVFTYNVTSYNGSSGKNARGLVQGPLDLDAALKFIESDDTLCQLPRYLIGHSWGAYSVCSVLNFGHKVEKVVSLSGFNSSIDITLDVAGKNFGNLLKLLLTPAVWFNQLLLFGKNMNLKAVDGINKSSASFLIIHADKDVFIDYEKTSIIAQKSNIINKNINYITIDTEPINDHNSYFCSVAATKYFKELIAKKELEIKENNKKKLSTDDKKKLRESADLPRANEINVELFAKIVEFLNS